MVSRWPCFSAFSKQGSKAFLKHAVSQLHFEKYGPGSVFFAFNSDHIDIVCRLITYLRKIETVLDLKVLRYRIDYLRGN